MNNTREHKMHQIVESINDMFSPESMILDEKIRIDGYLAIIHPRLDNLFEKTLYVKALRNLYGGSGAGIATLYDNDLSLYFYIENNFLRGGIYRESIKSKITCTINIENPIGLDDTYINKRTRAVFVKMNELLICH